MRVGYTVNMEYIYKKRELIYPNKELTLLDKLVLKFVSAIDFKYVVVSGYIAILFGRSRNTEDVDIFIEKIPIEVLGVFCKKLRSLGFYILDAEDVADAYDKLGEGFSVRFAKRGTTEPNFEVKFPKKDTDYYSMEHRIKVIISNKHMIAIAPLELQIAFKLYLGSEKDELDARHLYGIFKNDIDIKLLKDFINNLSVKSKYAEEVLGERLG